MSAEVVASMRRQAVTLSHAGRREMKRWAEFIELVDQKRIEVEQYEGGDMVPPVEPEEIAKRINWEINARGVH